MGGRVCGHVQGTIQGFSLIRISIFPNFSGSFQVGITADNSEYFELFS